MATIEQLNFELIVDDKDFDNKIKDIKQKAKDFNTDVSKLLDLNIKLNQQSVNKIKSDLKDIAKSAKALKNISVNVKLSGATAKNIQNQQAINVATQKYIDLIKLATQEYQNLNQQRAAGLGMTQQQLQQIIDQINQITGATGGGGNGGRSNGSRGGILGDSTDILRGAFSALSTYFSISAVKNFVRNLVDVTAEFEKQRIALGSMIGDMSAAARIFEQIKTLAVESPFQVQELVTYSKQLAAYSIPVNELFETTKMLADVSAGLGVDMGRIILAYGQIRAASFLRGQEVRQMTEAGIPILDELSKQISEFEGRAISVSEVFDRISTRQVTFEMVKKVFTDMTSEGGKFYRMQEVLAQTLSGKISNLKDAWQVSMNKIGQTNYSILGGAVDLAKLLAQNFDKVVRVLGSMTVGFTAVGVSMIKWAKLFELLRSKAAIIFYIGTAITWVISKTIDLARGNNELSKTLDIADKHILKYNNAIMAEDAKLRTLIKTLTSAKLGTQEYEAAKNNILSAYDEHLSAIDRENLAIGKTIGLYETLKNKITEATKAKYNEEAMLDLKANYESAVSTYFEQLDKWRNSASQAGFSNKAINQLRDFITGTIEQAGLNEETIRLIEFANKQRKTEEESLQKTISDASNRQDNFGNVPVEQILNLTAQRTAINIELLRNGFKQALEAYEAGVEKINSNFYPKTQELDSMRRLAQEIAGTKQNLAWGMNESFFEFVERIQDLYSKNIESIKTQKGLFEAAKTAFGNGKATEVDVKEKKDLLNRLNDEQRTMEELSKTFNFSLLEGKKARTKAGGTDEILKEIQEIQKIIGILRKLRSASEELKNLFSDWTQEQINVKLAEMFSFDTQYITDDYDKAIAEQINKARALANNPNISESAKNSLVNIATGYESDVFNKYVKDTKEAQTATERFTESLMKFIETSELEGTGYEFDISKALKKYTDDAEKARKKAEDLQSELNKSNLSEEQKKENSKSIADALAGNIDNASSTLADTLTSVTERAFKEWADRLGQSHEIGRVNLFEKIRLEKNFKSKLRGIAGMDISEMVNSLMVDDNMGFGFLDGLVFRLMSAGIYGEKLERVLTEIATKLSDSAKKTDDKKGGMFPTFKDLTSKDYLKMAGDGIGLLADQMQKYAEASGDSRMKEGAEILGTISELGQGFLQGGLPGLAMAAAKKIIETIGEELAYAAKLQAAIEKARHEAQMLKWDETMEVDSIFGVSQVKQMQEALKVMDEITDKYKELRTTLESQYVGPDWMQGIYSTGGIINFAGIPFISLIGGISDAQKQIDAFYDAVAKGYEGIEAYVVKFNDRGWAANFLGFADEYTNLKDLIEGLGYEMYDKYGNLNADALQAILDTYDRLDSADREWMEHAIDYSNEYAKAMEKVEEVMQDLYGGYVSDIVDSMIDKWIALGAVTADYAGALGDVAKNYAKMALQSALLDNVFNEEFEKKLFDATTTQNAKEVMRLFEDAQEQIEGMTPFIAGLLENLDQYFVNENGGDSISSGIKSITEETASLLASYVNAIRADVSVTRNNVQGIAGDVKALLGIFPTAPNLAEYLTQIQANTYNTQIATENILYELRGVIGTESGMTAVRVSM